MKRLKKKQIGPWCSYCEPKTTKATHRQDGFADIFCCHNHRYELILNEQENRKIDTHMTEADYETWNSL